MANICDNEIYIYCAEQDVDMICDFMEETFPYSDCALADKQGEESEIHYYFESKWSFPEAELTQLLTKLTSPEDFSATCLSVEWGCYYCAFHTSDGDVWSLE